MHVGYKKILFFYKKNLPFNHHTHILPPLSDSFSVSADKWAFIGVSWFVVI